MAQPLHDWVCDSCGRKIYGRRAVPKRCHAPPMRPMGSPWKWGTDAFYARFGGKELAEVTSDYWISPLVLRRLQVLIDEPGGPEFWESSVRRLGGYIEAQAYSALKNEEKKKAKT